MFEPNLVVWCVFEGDYKMTEKKLKFSIFNSKMNQSTYVFSKVRNFGGIFSGKVPFRAASIVFKRSISVLNGISSSSKMIPKL